MRGELRGEAGGGGRDRVFMARTSAGRLATGSTSNNLAAAQNAFQSLPMN